MIKVNRILDTFYENTLINHHRIINEYRQATLSTAASSNLNTLRQSANEKMYATHRVSPTDLNPESRASGRSLGTNFSIAAFNSKETKDTY